MTINQSIWERMIVHIDMDAFFAAVEIRDNPELKGKPVVVGGNPQGRGVVSTASYEARKFGIHSAMPAARAKQLCPDAIFLRPNFSKYSQVSDQVRSILSKYTELVEPVSIDEAYLDVTQNRLKIEDPILIAKMIQQNIFAATRLTASCGVAPNKYLAKIASDIKKPNGLTVVQPGYEKEFLENLPVRKIPGVGPVSEKELHKLGIKTVGELALKSREELIRLFGKWGNSLYNRARGIDHSPVITEWDPKQMSSEETFEHDLIEIPKMEAKIRELAEQVSFYLKRDHFHARTVTLKVKYSDFKIITRSKTFQNSFDEAEVMEREAIKLLKEKTEAGRRPIRLLGVGASHFEELSDEEPMQTEPDLFE